MNERNTNEKKADRVPAERSSKPGRLAVSRPRAGLRRGGDPARQAEEFARTFSDRWEW